jgi:hypothetical protein
MLDVVGASVQDISEDGRLVALTERRTRDNATTDNYRYGDPTFLAPSAARLVVVEIETGKRLLPLGDRLLQHPPGRVFARRQAAGDAGGAAQRSRRSRCTSGTPTARGAAGAGRDQVVHLIALNSALDWTADNARVVVAMRTAARDKDAADRFKALTQGPIIVHTSKEPFSIGTISAAPTLADRQRDRRDHRRGDRSDAGTQAQQLHRRARRIVVVFQEDATEKTDYDTIGGTESRLLAWTRGEIEPKTIFAPKDLKGLTLRWPRTADVCLRQAGRSVRAVARGGEARSLTPRPKSATPDAKPAAATPILTPDEKKETEAPESFSVTSFSRDGSKLLVTSRKGWYVVNVADATRKQILTLDTDEEKNPRIAI